MPRTLLRMFAAIAALALVSTTRADLAPFTEDFAGGNASWADGAGDPLAWNAGGFVSSTRDFLNTIEGDRVTLFRGELGLGSSGGAFAGNWLEGRVTEFSFDIRHDNVAPLLFFARFAGPANFPGSVGLDFTPAMPGQWTTLTIQIDPDNPLIIEEGPPGTFEATFANIGNLQIGLEVPASLAGSPLDVTFDLDNVSVVPAPGALAAFGLAALFGRRRRK